MIVKVGGKHYAKSESGKNLGGPYDTEDEARARLRQVEHFKQEENPEPPAREKLTYHQESRPRDREQLTYHEESRPRSHERLIYRERSRPK